MGTGKSTVGKRVAESLQFAFVDTDEEIAGRAGMSIPEIFSRHGEERFREMETSVLEDCCRGSHQVISTGGGVVTREVNCSILSRGGYVIWLKANPSVIYNRVKRNTERPLLKTPDPEKTIRDLLESRESAYAGCADLAIATDELSLEETIYGITETARFQGMGN